MKVNKWHNFKQPLKSGRTLLTHWFGGIKSIAYAFQLFFIVALSVSDINGFVEPAWKPVAITFMVAVFIVFNILNALHWKQLKRYDKLKG